MSETTMVKVVTFRTASDLDESILAIAKANGWFEAPALTDLMAVVEHILDAGHMSPEDLARLRAAWEASVSSPKQQSDATKRIVALREQAARLDAEAEVLLDEEAVKATGFSVGDTVEWDYGNGVRSGVVERIIGRLLWWGSGSEKIAAIVCVRHTIKSSHDAGDLIEFNPYHMRGLRKINTGKG